MCSQQLEADGVERALDEAHWHNQIEAQARAGRRVLAFARCRLGVGKQDLEHADVASGLTLLGLVGIIDPPRDEAIRAVAQCRAAGIRVVMITGDHGVTASAIARQLGMGEDIKAITGPELELMDDTAMRQAVAEARVFARASPEHKLRLVRALQANGEVVAMTGDGVNDAPALKQADVGVAMGMKGTEAAAGGRHRAGGRQLRLHRACRGRRAYRLRQPAQDRDLPTADQRRRVAVAAVGGAARPGAADHAGSGALGQHGQLRGAGHGAGLRTDRGGRDAALAAATGRTDAVALRDLADLLRLGAVPVGIFGMYQWMLAQGATVEAARTVAVNTLVCMEVFYLFSVRYLKAPSFTVQGVKGTPRVLVAVFSVFGLQLLFTYAPFMQSLFASEALPLDTGMLVVLAGVAVLLIPEIEKALLRRMGVGPS